MNTKITTLFEAYKAQREIAENAKAWSTKQNKILSTIKYGLVELMLEEQVKTIGTEDGCSLGLRRHVGFSSTEDNREQIRDWLVEETGDDQPFMEEVVSKKALNELVTKRVDAGSNENDFPDFLKVNLHPDISVLGWKQFLAKKQTQGDSAND